MGVPFLDHPRGIFSFPVKRKALGPGGRLSFNRKGWIRTIGMELSLIPLFFLAKVPRNFLKMLWRFPISDLPASE